MTFDRGTEVVVWFLYFDLYLWQKRRFILKMIEINARLLREQTPVFLCGEVVECFISFTNPSLPEHRIAQSNK